MNAAGGAIPFGVNLSFCVKRWVTPDLWAPLVREQLGVDLVQFSFDLIDPTWPGDLLDDLADDILSHTQRHGITVHSAFIGLAHYTYSQLLHPDHRVRDVAENWLVRAYRFARRAGISRLGGPLGAIASAADGREAGTIAEAEYADLIARMHRLATAAREAGIVELYVEPTPMRREWPWTVAQAQQMARDVADAAVPWKFCLDWGHGTFAPLYGEGAGPELMAPWFHGLRDSIGVVHIQQTDFRLDRHWDFTEPGAVDPAAAAALQRAAGLADWPVFLEVFYPFERDDASVLAAMQRSVALIAPAFRAPVFA
jgi:sugar phosphate isomerase/epimerase